MGRINGTVSQNHCHEYGKVIRHNTLIDGYVPMLREVQGVVSLAWGCYDVFSEQITSNRRQGIIGRARINDGVINLVFSPIVVFSLGFFAGISQCESSM